jgi:hypothetical protein
LKKKANRKNKQKGKKKQKQKNEKRKTKKRGKRKWVTPNTQPGCAVSVRHRPGRCIGYALLGGGQTQQGKFVSFF